MTATLDHTHPVYRWARTRRIKIVVDTSLLAAFGAEFITREGPDYTIHSWIGIVLIPIITIHLFGNASWIRRLWTRKRRDREFNLGVLNATLGALATVCIATGFPLWLDWSEATAWSAVHTFTGMASILVMFAHLWVNRGRITRLVNIPARQAS